MVAEFEFPAGMAGTEIIIPTAYIDVLGGLATFGLAVLGKGKPLLEPTELIGVGVRSPETFDSPTAAAAGAFGMLRAPS